MIHVCEHTSRRVTPLSMVGVASPFSIQLPPHTGRLRHAEVTLKTVLALPERRGTRASILTATSVLPYGLPLSGGSFLLADRPSAIQLHEERCYSCSQSSLPHSLPPAPTTSWCCRAWPLAREEWPAPLARAQARSRSRTASMLLPRPQASRSSSIARTTRRSFLRSSAEKALR